MAILDNPLTYLNDLIQFMEYVVGSNKMPYKIVSQNMFFRLAPVPLSFQAWFSLYDGDLAYSPDLTLFFTCFRDHRIRECTNPDSYNYAIAANDFVTWMRQEGQRTHVKRKIKDWQRNAIENQKRLNEYLDNLFDRYARLMVVRLDLHYHKAACKDTKNAHDLRQKIQVRRYEQRDKFMRGEDIPPVSDEKIGVDIDEVKKDWARLHDNMRGKRTLFEHLVGYVVRFEFAKVAGYHIHVTLFFDGSKVRQDKHYAEEIGKYWIETTQERGYFFSCNRTPGRYKFPALGIIDHHDTEKRKNLYSSLRYLAKTDQFVRVKTSPKAKLFLTGHINPKPKKSGRPRGKNALLDTQNGAINM